jgi:4-amino-4-deoxy-L-arabinose transferase-like glycosyltransferase
MRDRFSSVLQSILTLDRRRFLLGVLLVGLILRVGFVFAAGDAHDTWKLHEYGAIARNLAGGAGFAMHWWYNSSDSARQALQQRPPEFEGAFMPPMNVYFVYLAYMLFGVDAPGAHWALMLFYALVGALTPVALYHTTRRFAGERAARLAAMALVVFPPAIFAVTTFSGSVLFQCGALIVMLLAIAASEEPSARSFLRLGIACGVMVFLRSEFMMLGLLIIATALLLALLRNGRSALAPGAVGALAMLFVVAPWTVRNYTIFHRFIPVISHPWGEIWRGNNDYAEASSFDAEGASNWFANPLYHPVTTRLDSLPYDSHFELAADSIFRQEVMSFVGRRPAKALSLALQRVLLLWTVDIHHPMAGKPIYIAMIIPTLGLLLFGFVVTVRRNRGRADWAPVVLYGVFFLFTSAIVAITHVQPRHQVYLVVVSFPFIGVALERLLCGPLPPGDRARRGEAVAVEQSIRTERE